MRIVTLRIAAISFLCGCFGVSSSAQLKLTKEADDLRGPVRTVQTTNARIQKDYPSTKLIEINSPTETVSYDRQGRRTEEYSGPLNDSSTKRKEVYVYDSERLKEIAHYDEEGKIVDLYAASYDEQGRLMSVIGTARMEGSFFGLEAVPILSRE